MAFTRWTLFPLFTGSKLGACHCRSTDWLMAQTRRTEVEQHKQTHTDTRIHTHMPGLHRCCIGNETKWPIKSEWLVAFDWASFLLHKCSRLAHISSYTDAQTVVALTEDDWVAKSSIDACVQVKGMDWWLNCHLFPYAKPLCIVVKSKKRLEKDIIIN